MVTYYTDPTIKMRSGDALVFVRCISTDTKPTDVPVNTIATELDTSKDFYFDGTNWTQCA